jgi:hypothetical protein
MGMYDEIIVPKSYLKGLLNEKNEKLFDTNHSFQTKDLENLLCLYKIYRQRLYKREHKKGHSNKDEWKIVNDNVDINFYDIVKDSKGNEWDTAFDFSFSRGRLDKKKLVSLKVLTTAKERNEIDKMWDTEQQIFDFYRNNSIKYKIFTFLEKIFNKATNWARKKHQLPLSLRKEAYEKSGRLKKDPKALDVYMDI